MTDDVKKPYHDAMVSAWRIFIEERTAEQFSDEWWREIVGEYAHLMSSYHGTPLHDYVSYMSQAFLDEWERIQKRERQKGISETVLPETQRYHQEEIQFTETIPPVVRREESSKSFTSADWG